MRCVLGVAVALAAAAACEGGRNATSEVATTTALTTATASPAVTTSAGAAGGPMAAAAPRAGMNPVQTEMALLHQATLTSVDAVVNNTLAAVPAAFERVDSARRNTVAFLERGQYRPPKHPERMADFAGEDDAFHPQLAALLAAAQANDLPRATRQLGVVLDGCTRCHATFRF